MEEKQIVVFGAGGLGRETVVLLHQINEALPQWQIKGFYDDAPPTEPHLLYHQPYLGTSHDLNAIGFPLHVVIAVGDGKIRARIRQRLTNPLLSFPSLIHPSVAVKPYQGIRIGEGCLVCQGSILTTNITLGDYVLVNLACTIGHDTVVGDYASLMHNVNLGGHTTLAEYTYLGTNATVLPFVQIGRGSIIGAGAVVTKPIPPHCTAVGVPAKVISTHEHLP